MEDNEPLFLMQILDGYAFRNLMGIVKHEINQVSMILSEKTIEISFLGSNGRSAHLIKINTVELVQWRYNIRDDDDQLVSEYPIAFDTTELFNITKSVGKRDSILIYLLPGENQLNVKLLKVSTKDPGSAEVFMIKILTIEHTRYAPNEYTNEPNIRILAKNFSEMCGCIIDQKCEHLQIEADNTGIIFTGIQANKSVSYIKRYEAQNSNSSYNREQIQLASNIGDIANKMKNLNIGEKKTGPGLSLNVVNSNTISIKVPISTIKSINKLNNVTNVNGALLKFTIEVRKPLKISTNISSFGQYEIFLV